MPLPSILDGYDTMYWSVYIVCLTGAISQTVLLVCLLKDPLKCFRNSATYLVANLAVCDLAVLLGFVFGPVGVARAPRSFCGEHFIFCVDFDDLLNRRRSLRHGSAPIQTSLFDERQEGWLVDCVHLACEHFQLNLPCLNWDHASDQQVQVWTYACSHCNNDNRLHLNVRSSEKTGQRFGRWRRKTSTQSSNRKRKAFCYDLDYRGRYSCCESCSSYSPRLRQAIWPHGKQDLVLRFEDSAVCEFCH